MARETLPVALELMFAHDVNAKTDKGGPTKYGITHRTLAAYRGKKSVTSAEVRAMSRQEAVEIYRRSYWTQSGGDLLPPGLDYAAFDFGVNSGPARAVKALQKLLGVREDGVVGERTVNAAHRFPGGMVALIRAYCEERMRYLRTLSSRKTGFPVKGRGWTIRVTGKDPKGQLKDQSGVIGNALKLAADASGASVRMDDIPRTLLPKRAPRRTAAISASLKSSRTRKHGDRWAAFFPRAVRCSRGPDPCNGRLPPALSQALRSASSTSSSG